jgi:hypothetical protein
MLFNSAPVSALYVRIVAQKRNEEILAFTLLASDQPKVTQKNAIYSKYFTSNVDFELFNLYAEEVRETLNFKTVEFVK